MLLWFFFNYLYYVASIYVMYLCSIFSQGIHNKNDPNKGSGAVRTCNLEHLHAFQIIKSRHTQ